MIHFLKLFNRLILRTVREEPFLTVLSVLGVALGIGLFLGVTVATSRAIASFQAAVQGLGPAYQYEVVSLSSLDFPEQVYPVVRTLAPSSMPLLATNAFLPEFDETVRISALATVNALEQLRGPGDSLDIKLFLTRTNAVLISRRLSEERGLGPGDGIIALVYNRKYKLLVAGILDHPSLPSHSVIMDLGNFQELFGKSGVLSRIDVNAGPDQVARIKAALPAGISIEKKESVLRNRSAMLDSFRFNLRFVTFLAVLVGVFLLYNTVFISLVRRRTEIGILRGLGMPRRTVAGLFAAQGVLLGLCGSVLGVLIGQAAAWFSTTLVGKTITRFYGPGEASPAIVTPGEAAWTLAAGILFSFAASLVPSLESANVMPVESSRAGTFEKGYMRRHRFLAMAGTLLLGAGAVLVWIDYRFVPFATPWLSYAGILLFILGCTLNAPSYLLGAVAALRPLLFRMFRSSARIAAGDIAGTRYRFSLALMSVAVSSALIVAIVTSVHSLKRSFLDWINTYVSADVYIKPGSCTSNFCFYPLPGDAVRTVERIPGIEAVGRFRALRIDFRGRQVIAGFGNSALISRYWAGGSSGEREQMARLARHREVVVSEYLSAQCGIKKGDTILVQTPKGRIPFVVSGTSISYSTTAGFLYFDRRWLREYWGLDDTTQLSIYLVHGQDVSRFTAAASRALRGYALDIENNREFRASVISTFDRSFAVTYAIELVAIVVSLIGVVNALLILVFEKKQEIAVLRYLGASWGQIRQVMVLSAGIIGIAGICLGSAMGIAIAAVITHVINRISFGWDVAISIPLAALLLLMGILLLTTVLAGLLPSSLARKIDPKAFISFE